MTYEIKDNVLDAPEFGDYTQYEIDSAIDKLIYEVEHNCQVWDEDFDYKLDMVNEILAIQFGDESMSEKAILIRDAIAKYLAKWAKDAVESNPDAYCEREELDKSDYYREVA